MRYFSTLAILAVSALAISANAQSGLEKKGDKLVKKFKYDKAIGKYTKAADKDSTNFSAVQKLAQTYVAKGDYASAEIAYQRVLADARATSADKLAYAQILRSNGKYEEAAKAFGVYAQAEPNSNIAKEFNSFDKEIKLLNRDNKMYELVILPENSSASDVGASYSKDGLVLSSNRKASEAKQAAGSNYADARFDLYTATTGTDSISPAPGRLRGKVNGKWNDGAATFTRDGKEMIFTQTNKVKGKNKSRTLGLYHADWDSTTTSWVNIQALPFNNVDYNVSQPSISKDGSKLYFVSDMPGGLGGTDIYVAEKQGITWAPAVTLGNAANTAGNEVSPFIADDGTLYFASDARIGLGGLDIYSITPNASGRWGTPVNLGMPANSSSDDFGYVSNESGKHGYIVSNRPGGMGKEDIYKFMKRSEPVCGNIADSRTKAGVAGVEILAVSPSGERFTATTDAKGDFCIALTPGREYKISTTKDGYFAHESNVSVRPTRNDRQLIALKQKGGIDVIVDVTEQGKGDVEGATVQLINKATGEVQEQKSAADGKVVFDAFPDQQYDVVVKKNMGKEGLYNRFMESISTAGLRPSQSVSKDAKLTFYDGKFVFDLPNVFFDYNSAVLRPIATKELDKVAKVMKDIPFIEVELSSHTDSRGSSEYNLKLSGYRAQACVTYLAKLGVDKKRLLAIGYGESQIRNKCVDGVECSEAEHTYNRRSEFKVLKVD